MNKTKIPLYGMNTVKKELQDLGLSLSPSTLIKIYRMHFPEDKLQELKGNFTRREVEDLKRFFWVYKYPDKEYPIEKFTI